MQKLFAVALATFALAGCGLHPVATATSSHGASALTLKDYPPAITYVTANGIIGSSFVSAPNYPVQFVCAAVASSPLTYNWLAFGPIFNYGSMATWTSPAAPGTYDIQVWARDMQGRTAWRDVWVQVRPQANFGLVVVSGADKATAKKLAAPTLDGYKADSASTDK